jgi:hypothetical protein
LAVRSGRTVAFQVPGWTLAYGKWRALFAFVILDSVSMRVLYAVFVLCLVAIVWTIVAVTRHIRNHGTQTSEPLHLTGGSNEDPLKNPE